MRKRLKPVFAGRRMVSMSVVCGTRFSKEQWEQMNAAVEYLNEGGKDEETLKDMYNGFCPVRYHRTTRGGLVAEMVEEEVEMPYINI